MATAATTPAANPTNLADLEALHQKQMGEQYALMGFQMRQNHDNQMVAARSNSQKSDHDAMMAVASNLKS